MSVENKSSFNFKRRIQSMLKVDMRRMYTSPLYYLIIGISLVVPILIFVMTTMMDGTTTQAPDGTITVIEGFKNVWQALGSISANKTGMTMDLVSMCNIDMMFFMIGALVCLFVGADFRSGYVKNLFTVRSSKTDYVISKTITCIFVGFQVIIAYFIGSLIGGAISGLSFELEGISIYNIVMCILTKFSLVGVFVPLFLVMSVVGKNKVWLSMILAFGASMLLFTMVSMISPLDSTIMNFVLGIAGGTMFSFGIGIISKIVLDKTSLI